MTAISKSTFLKLIDELHELQEAKSFKPEEIIGAILSDWCTKSYRGLGRSGLPTPVKLKKSRIIEEFVEFVDKFQLEEGMYWLSSAYSLLIGAKDRREQSLYFTPPSLTKRLLDDLVSSGADYASDSFCDPACGGAAFLAPIAIRIRKALKKQGKRASTILRHIESNVIGIDKNSVLCSLSCHFLRMALHTEIIKTGIKPCFKVQQGDSLALHEIEKQSIDNVVCNPPFRKMTSDDLDTYDKNYDEVVQAQPNIYALFIARCVSLVNNHGRCAFVTPTSFLSGKNFSALRNFLMHETKIKRIGMVSDRQGVFIDVLQETALTVLQKRKLKKQREIKAQVCLVDKLGQYINIGRCYLPNSGSIWPIPRTNEDILLLRHAIKSRFRLEDYGYKIRIGYFVWNRDKKTTYFSKSIASRVRNHLVAPLLWSSDIRPNGTIRFDGKRKNNGEPCFINIGSIDHPSLIRRPSVLLQRVTSNDQPKRLVAAAVPKQLFREYGGFVGENHTVVLEQATSSPVLSPTQLARMLRSSVIDRYFRCISGATNVSSFELNELVLPSPNRLKRYLAQGVELEKAVERSFGR